MIENPGPLAEMPNQPAKNFYGGRYNMEVLQEDRIMYRAGNAQIRMEDGLRVSHLLLLLM